MPNRNLATRGEAPFRLLLRHRFGALAGVLAAYAGFLLALGLFHWAAEAFDLPH